MTMYKSEMIREICKENLQFSNREIKSQVWRRYGRRVESNEIINAVGSEKDRLSYGRNCKLILKAGNEFINKCGSYDQARRILAICGRPQS